MGINRSVKLLLPASSCCRSWVWLLFGVLLVQTVVLVIVPVPLSVEVHGGHYLKRVGFNPKTRWTSAGQESYCYLLISLGFPGCGRVHVRVCVFQTLCGTQRLLTRAASLFRGYFFMGFYAQFLEA